MTSQQVCARLQFEAQLGLLNLLPYLQKTKENSFNQVFEENFSDFTHLGVKAWHEGENEEYSWKNERNCIQEN